MSQPTQQDPIADDQLSDATSPNENSPQTDTIRIWKMAAVVTGVTGIGLILAAGVIEVLFRIFGALQAAPIQWTDRPHRYYLSDLRSDRPNPYKVLDRTEGAFRILVLGDSFTFGQGMQRSDTFPAKLQTLIGLNKNAQIEVLNWGVKGYSTTQEVALLKKGIDNVKPDLVILEITLNDPELQPYRVTHSWLDEHGRIKLTNPIFTYWTSLRFLTERVLNSQTRRDYLKYYDDLFENPITWNPFADSLRTFKTVADSRSVASYAVVFPLFSHTVNEKYPFNSEHDKVDQELKTIGITYQDLRTEFTNIPSERLQVIPGLDSHPNEIAHRIAAESIYLDLSRRKILPEEMRHPAFVRSR